MKRNSELATKTAAAAPAMETMLTQVLNDLPDGALTLDEHWRITYANRSARRISRIRPEDLNSQTLWDLYPGIADTPLEQLCHDVMQTRVPGVLDAYFYEPFSIWVEIHALPAGSGIALYYRDVTATQQAETVRRKSDERTRLALAAANGIGTWDWDVPADLVVADEQFAILYGVDPQRAATGVPFAEFTRNILPEDAAAFAEAVALALRSGGDFISEYRLAQADGSLCWVSARGRCALDAAGSPLRFTGVSIDITDRKRTQAALIQSEKLAAVGRMASSIAHEINNPLEAVTNLIYIARQYSVVPEVQEFLDVADQELRRVSIIANQTLRFHKQSSLPHEVTCQELFTTVMTLYEGRLRNSAIAVEKRKRAHRRVSCFEGEIRQVLNNLVGNSIDAMPGGGRLLLRSREATDWRTGRHGIALTVADTGAGISPVTRARIFEPFFTTKGMNGTGLGLWISDGIVDRHQGRLLLRSSQDPAHPGTVCILFLPLEPVRPKSDPLVN
jgi:signal transduction histidine kinase